MKTQDFSQFKGELLSVALQKKEPGGCYNRAYECM